MALDILVNESNKMPGKTVSLYIDDYDLIMEQMKDDSRFPVMKANLVDYYGESTVYTNELETLRLEITQFKDSYGSSCPNTLLDFLHRLSDLVDYAIERQEVIKFVGD